jgi:hypothetical protein
MHQRRRFAASPNGHHQRIGDELRGHARLHRRAAVGMSLFQRGNTLFNDFAYRGFRCSPILTICNLD